MARLRILTSGESHGRGLAVTIAGLPAGLELDREALDGELARRQGGHGRGKRMAIEGDEVDVLSGVRMGVTLGSPVTLLIWNRDWANWQEDMGVWRQAGQSQERPEVRRPRPGHADLAGAQKYGHRDLRNCLERASARETAARVAAGAVCKQLLGSVRIAVRSQVLQVGSVAAEAADLSDEDAWRRVERSPVRCADETATQRMIQAVDAAEEDGDTLGGIGEVVALGVPPGLGSYATWEERLDAALAGAVMGIPSVKGVEVGDGWAGSGEPGSRVHDEIVPCQARPWGLARKTNRAGGVEGGVSNGEPIVVRLAFKPIPTLRRPLASVNLDTGEPETAHSERADVCVVPAGCVVGEAMVAVTLADALLSKLGGDCLGDLLAAYRHYLARLGGMVGRED